MAVLVGTCVAIMALAGCELFGFCLSESVEMVAVHGGSFMMGAEDISFGKPVHQVNLPGFRMGKYEITQAQYLSVTGSNPSHFSGTERPAETLTWFDAVEFCNALSLMDGFAPVYMIMYPDSDSRYPIRYPTVTADMTKNGYRLPTEAEWEYAARGGSGSPYDFTYSGSNDAGAVAWYADNSERATHAAGTKLYNGLGLFDMSGNVWEWCGDWFGDYESGTQTDPTGAASGPDRVLRGGSWANNALGCETVIRFFTDPFIHIDEVGFRVVRRP
jgi:formylglycine-generating enzyme required for sulfatase activity